MRWSEQTLQDNYNRWKNKDYLFEKINGSYQAVAYGEFLDKSYMLAKYLLDLGLAGKSIVLYGNNSSRLMMADLAILQYVGISVWVSKEWTKAEVQGAVDFLDVDCIIHGPEKQDIVDAIKLKNPNILCISTEEFDEVWRVQVSKSGLIPKGEQECCKIVFSSGTTAAPKAVMLSKKNIFAGLKPLYRRCPFGEKDVDYLFLPLNHTYGGIYNFLYSLVFGFSIYLCSDVAKMAQEILEVQPTMFCGVPLIYRRFYEGYGENIGRAFGTRIQYLFCGGAHFDEKIRHAYKEGGLNLMEAYALSETASTFSIQYPEDMDTKTAGTIAENLDVKIDNPDESGCGEILVKGDNVFLGYAGNPELTENAFTEDGYFRTGDIGFIKPDEVHGGHKLYITGRCKKQLIGENGEVIDPVPIETMIQKRDADINKALLYIQDGRLGCKLYIKDTANTNWEAFFDKINAMLPGYERIKVFEVIMDSVEKRLKQ